MLDSKLYSKGILSKRLLDIEVFTFIETINWVQQLPYGRNSDRANPNLLLEELKGTCSTKHAFLKKVALEQEYDTVKLFLCMFKMNAINTRKIASVLEKYKLPYIPEAHCVLQIDQEFVDVTNEQSEFHKLEKDVIEFIEIQPEQIGVYKLEFHKNYLINWLQKENLQYSFEELWNIRELCIKMLSE